MNTSDFEYVLPPERIAQSPVTPRDASQLLRLNRATGAIEEGVFHELPDRLRAGDLLVVNDTRVFPARLKGTRESTGGKIEVFLLHPENDSGGAWMAWTRSGGRLNVGERLLVAGGRVAATIVERRGALGDLLRFECETGRTIEDYLDEHGQVPLPPYIARDPVPEDAERYQTVYARQRGAVAAPTAGLHFTEELLARLEGAGVERRAITLHVGPGTFRPVKAETIAEHEMLPERYEIPEETAGAIARAKADGRRVVAVGTTVMRALEARAREGGGTIAPGAGSTDLFIRSPFAFQTVDALITNFHLPRSTLLMLVCAFATRERIFAAYDHALAGDYRFFSYGDAMLID